MFMMVCLNSLTRLLDPFFFQLMIFGVSWIKNTTNLKRRKKISFPFKPDGYTIQTFLVHSIYQEI